MKFLISIFPIMLLIVIFYSILVVFLKEYGIVDLENIIPFNFYIFLGLAISIIGLLSTKITSKLFILKKEYDMRCGEFYILTTIIFVLLIYMKYSNTGN